MSGSTVSDALSRVKAGKSDGSTLISNHFIYASSSLTEFLSKLFTAMLRHGYVPQCLRDCIMQPIPKPGKDPSDSDSYRPIALAPTLSKVFEWCILLEFSSSFTTSPLQFGFKRSLSTDLCTGLLKNIIGRYNVHDSTVYGCFLDASKAFDRVGHSLLFDKLLKRKLSPVVARTLLAWYSQQKVSISWNSSLSDKFSITNGVRQGGVLSPILFTIYIDDLLSDLEKMGVGCYWRQHFVGAVCYADDIALLAPSPAALRLMLDACSRFASAHSLIFNAAKTQLIRFSPSSSCSTSGSNFLFYGQNLSYNSSVVHLGHVLSSNLSDNEDIITIKKDLCKKANSMISVFSCCDVYTKTKLLRSFCLSLYGSCLWKASAAELHHLEVTFNNVIRKIWSLPRRCHTGILHSVANLYSIYNVVVLRSKKLSLMACNSPSSLLFSECKTQGRMQDFMNGGSFTRARAKIFTDHAHFC